VQGRRRDAVEKSSPRFLIEPQLLAVCPNRPLLRGAWRRRCRVIF